MHSKRLLGACLAGALLAPATPAPAQDGDDRLRPVLARAITGGDGVTAQAADAAHKRLVRRHMTVARRYADLKDVILDEPSLGAAHMTNSSREVREATQRLRAKNEALRKARRAERRAAERAAGGSATGPGSGSGGGSAPSGSLQSIAQCESGGDPGAVGGGGAYRGKYQFDRQTWSSVGGSGDPAAAPESEQDRRAQMLLRQRGTSPWPTCG